MAVQNIFERRELKYLITQEQKGRLLQVMEPFMEADAYGRSTICSIYFDTPDRLLIRRSLEKPAYKEKLRLRSYGTATPESPVFLELKKKYHSVVYKRRISAAEHAAMDYMLKGNVKGLLPGGMEGEQRQILSEIDYVCRFYGNLEPAVFLSYEREAFCGREDAGLRITFDRNILWREEGLSLCSGVYGAPLLAEGQSLMEIKTACAIPIWLARALSGLHIYQTSFSKYGNAYQRRMERDKGGQRYA